MARLLIVDDEPDIIALIRRYAERAGYETASASNGVEAVALCRENDYDLIVMDVMMPEMDGFMACKEIRKEKDIPVLMLSARGEEYDKLFGFEVGVELLAHGAAFGAESSEKTGTVFWAELALSCSGR